MLNFSCIFPQGQAVINPIAHRLTLMAVEKMELFRFLLNLLSSFPEHYDIAFKIGLLSLELPRAPASIKPLEVRNESEYFLHLLLLTSLYSKLKI